MADLTVVPVGKKQCKPFILEVFVASPESGYKFELIVEKSCTSTNDSLWKLVFDLYKKDSAGVFQQLVHVSFKPTEPTEQQGVEALATEPVNVETARVLRKEVHPTAKAVAETAKPTAKQKKALHDAMSKAARKAIEV
ncbi:MAG: hypothetical protein M3Y03_01010 [Verrucomicrobiota bacterium]|nr:hypothetical protein [Verrucomicrobiota bacterium]